MHETFAGAISFSGGELSKWDVSNVVDFIGTFRQSLFFNADLSGWNTSSARSFAHMFEGAESFNGNVSTWNTSSVGKDDVDPSLAPMFAAGPTTIDSNDYVSDHRDFARMFANAISFNQELPWDVSGGRDFDQMFAQATSFEGRGLDQWNVSSAETMEQMFYGASSFSQNLCRWHDLLDDDVLASAIVAATACNRTEDPDFVTGAYLCGVC